MSWYVQQKHALRKSALQAPLRNHSGSGHALENATGGLQSFMPTVAEGDSYLVKVKIKKCWIVTNLTYLRYIPHINKTVAGCMAGWEATSCPSAPWPLLWPLGPWPPWPGTSRFPCAVQRHSEAPDCLLRLPAWSFRKHIAHALPGEKYAPTGPPSILQHVAQRVLQFLGY